MGSGHQADRILVDGGVGVMTKTRDYWIETLLRIARPVFLALSNGCLRESMPVETSGDRGEHAKYTHLEALGRSLAGIGPWLNSSEGSNEKETQRLGIAELVCESLKRATDRSSKDYLNFSDGQQPIVDAAFLAQGLLRSWDTVWVNLDAATKSNIVDCMIATRSRNPGHNNWLLFSAMIEVFVFKAGCEWDRMRVDYALRQHEQWYKGDGAYGDGPQFHWDYYNSFVIQPMLYEIITIGGEVSETWQSMREPIARRIQRYATVQERFIGPDGSFPPIGRSLAYRFGAFHALALVAFESMLPPEIAPASVRCALTAVIKRMVDRDDVFDDDGWLRIGFCGHQPSIGEEYISTGSLYLCLCGLLPLGLPASSPFWADPDRDWTSRRIWNGESCVRDHAIGD